LKRLFVRCVVFIVLFTATAHAGSGVNLRWSNCLGDGGTLNRNFACNTNSTPSHVLVSSFELGQPILQASGNEVGIDIATSSAAIPAWWEFRNTGACRQNSLSANFTVPVTAVNCVDWASGQASGGIAAYTVQFDPNVVRIKLALAVPLPALADLDAGQEYFSNNIVINNQKTVGAGSCGGCDVGACLILQYIRVTTPVAANDRTISGSTVGTDSYYALWQGGGNPVTHKGTGCPRATPTRQETWGSVKALYR
jgi:hypothetical protein